MGSLLVYVGLDDVKKVVRGRWLLLALHRGGVAVFMSVCSVGLDYWVLVRVDCCLVLELCHEWFDGSGE